MEQHLEELEKRVRESGDVLEGNCFYMHQSLTRLSILESKQTNIRNLIKSVCEKVINPKICEIGVNAGHSLLLMLESCGGTACQFLLFDLGEHTYTRSCLDYLASQYQQSRIMIHFGTSLLTLPLWLSHNKDAIGTFDAVHVDGGHTMECIVSDMGAAIQLTKPGGYIIVDDCNDKNIASVCEMWIQIGVVRPIPQLYSIVYPHILLQKMDGIN